MNNDEHAEKVEILEIVDIEIYAQDGKEPPLAKVYRFKVNDTMCISNTPVITGRQILEKANLLPPEQYTLREKIKGGTPRRIELDEEVNLRKPGVEKFRAIRHGQTEGECNG